MARFYNYSWEDFDKIISKMKFFQQLTIIGDGKILIDMELKNHTKKQVVLQFENKEEAEIWLYEHFEMQQYNIKTREH